MGTTGLTTSMHDDMEFMRRFEEGDKGAVCMNYMCVRGWPRKGKGNGYES